MGFKLSHMHMPVGEPEALSSRLRYTETSFFPMQLELGTYVPLEPGS